MKTNTQDETTEAKKSNNLSKGTTYSIKSMTIDEQISTEGRTDKHKSLRCVFYTKKNIIIILYVEHTKL